MFIMSLLWQPADPVALYDMAMSKFNSGGLRFQWNTSSSIYIVANIINLLFVLLLYRATATGP